MTQAAPEVMSLADDWLAILDEQIASLEAALGHLKALIRAVTTRDARAMEVLLDEAANITAGQAQTDRRREAVRGALAQAMGWTPRQTTLTRLATELPAPERHAVLQRRDRIVRIAADLRREHLIAATVLREYGRINRAILGALVPGGSGLTTYDTSGKAAWRPDRGLFDTRR